MIRFDYRLLTTVADDQCVGNQPTSALNCQACRSTLPALRHTDLARASHSHFSMGPHESDSSNMARISAAISALTVRRFLFTWTD